MKDPNCKVEDDNLLRREACRFKGNMVCFRRDVQHLNSL
jgi:hypothetical protein